MNKLINLVVLFAFVISITGCATILKEKETKMPVSSEPEGAEVFLGRGRHTTRVGRTPTTVTLDNRRSYWITLRKDGYEEATYATKPRIAHGWMLASFLCLIGPAIVDALTMNAMSFKEKEIKVTLDPILQNQASQTTTKK